MPDSPLDLSGEPSPAASPAPAPAVPSHKSRPMWLLFLGFFLGLGFGGPAGFAIGTLIDDDIRGALGKLVPIEEHADVANPRKLDRKMYALQFPGNWAVDAKDEDYHPDSNFSIESPSGTSSVGVQLWDPNREEAAILEEWAGHFAAVYDGEPERTKFSTWGELEGSGILLKGTRGLLIQYETRIFVKKGAKKTVVIWEEIDVEERKKTTPGFELIRSTFRFKDGK